MGKILSDFQPEGAKNRKTKSENHEKIENLQVLKIDPNVGLDFYVALKNARQLRVPLTSGATQALKNALQMTTRNHLRTIPVRSRGRAVLQYAIVGLCFVGSV